MTSLQLLLFLSEFFSVNSSKVLSVFPSTYSQYFGNSLSQVDITFSEAFLFGEENQNVFGLSLWIRIINIESEGTVFKFELVDDPNGFKYFNPRLEYSPPDLLALTLAREDLIDFSKITINFVPSTNWIFLAFSASKELATSILYCNNLGTEIYKSGSYSSTFPVKFGSKLWFGGYKSIMARIGDVKFYNNIYNDAADWNLIYLNSCTGISCTDLYPNICYAECDQWCKSESEWFLPLVQPTLNSITPYLNISETLYDINYYDIYAGVNEPVNGWSDYSITGWVQLSKCYPNRATFFQLEMSLSVIPLDISLTASSSSNLCDTLKAKIYNKDATNYVYSFTSLNSLNYIGNWLFLAVTINSGSKLLSLYAQNGVNPPSASHPLISSSINYPYTAIPVSSSIKINIGANNGGEFYPGNYADFRLYPWSYIDATLLQYDNNIYSAATYFDPHCVSWSSIWYCQTCEIGYFIKNGLCQKCHPSCAACSSEDTEENCLSCANGYYAQPGNPSLCFDYCPLGYTWDTSLNKCVGVKGAIANIYFDNNLSGDFIFSNIYVNFGVSSSYYPNSDILDPLPANKRGIYYDNAYLTISPQSSIQAGRLVSTDFTIDLWVMANSYGDLYKSTSGEEIIKNLKTEAYYQGLISDFRIEPDGRLLFSLHKDFKMPIIYAKSPRFITNFSAPEWGLYSLSLSYDNLSKTTQVIMARNKDYYIGTFSTHFKELSGTIHHIGYMAGSVHGFIYSFAMYNYGKSYSEILLSLGACSSCSACPAALSYCLPTCDRTEYVDEDGKCQKCLSSCSGTCSRAGTCNLCYDKLCYKCAKYEIGTCTQCVEHANMKNGQCECEIGYIEHNSKCVNKCEDGYYLDINAQLCLSCPDNCLKCSNGDNCIACEKDLVLENGICKCPDKYYLNSSHNCSKCDNSCLTCSIISSNCTSCIQSEPILYDTNKCYPCYAFEGYSTSFAIPLSDFTDDLLSQLSSCCIEICGDGWNMGQSQCDDGNTNNGDGCSSNCEVETGWSCFGGSLSSLDICKDTIPPSPILAYLNENSAGYLLTLSFSEAVTLDSDISKNIKIEIDGVTKFSWSISFKNSIYTIALEIYENVASGTNVIVNFIDPSNVVDRNGNEMQESYAETKLENSFTYQLGELMESSVKTVTTSAVAGAVIGSMFSGLALGMFKLQELWGMIEMMQMQYYLIFLSPKYPDNLLSYISALGISNGNFLPNPFQKYLIKKDPFPDPPEIFLEENFNTDFIMSAGHFLLVWLLIMAGLPITLLLFKFFPRVAIIRWLKKSYLFSILLRIIIESFLAINLSVFLQWREISEPSQKTGYLSLILSFIAMACLILTFALVIWQVTLKSEEELAIKTHKRRFGTLYEGFKSNSTLLVSFLLFQNIRRVLFIIYCVFLYEYTIMQVALSNTLSFIYTILLILLRPYKSNILGNGLHIFSELLYFSAHCVILKFLDDQLSDEYRVRLGWIVVALLSFSLALHVIALFIAQIIGLIKGLKHLKESFMKNFANKFVRGRRSNAKSIVLDNTFSSKRENSIDENKRYPKRKRKQIVVMKEICTRITRDDESFNTDTTGDESLMRK